MKAAVVGEPFGVENLRIENVEDPQADGDGIIVRVVAGSLNPVDINAIGNKTVYGIKPVPHIVGSEVFGMAETSGNNIREGDRVLVYPRIFDGTCDNCLSGREYLCRNGGIFGIISNGGFCEKVSIGEQNLIKIPDAIDDDLASSMTVGALTAYHAILRAEPKPSERIIIYGGSGNTGLFAIQIAKAIGLEVHAVSRRGWVRDFGADFVYDAGEIPKDLHADIVINSLGSSFWDSSLKHLDTGGRLVTFGVQTGVDANLKLSAIYVGEEKIVGSTGGSRKELVDLIRMAVNYGFRTKVQARYPLDRLKDAVGEFPKRENGRIIIRMKEHC